MCCLKPNRNKEFKAITEKLKESSIKEVKGSQNLRKRGETLKDQTPKPKENARQQCQMANIPTIRGCCEELDKSPHIQTKKKSIKQSSVRSCDGMMTSENKFSHALPQKIDYSKLVPYFGYRPVCQETSNLLEHRVTEWRL